MLNRETEKVVWWQEAYKLLRTNFVGWTLCPPQEDLSVFLFYGFPNLCRFLKRNAMDLECFDVNVFVSQTVDTEDIVIIKIKNRRQYE